MSASILLVEDNQELALWLHELLTGKAFTVTLCHRGDEVQALLAKHSFDLIILDGILPGIDGFELCKRLKPDYSGPILFLTACDEEVDEVLALELGADDFLTKPVRARVLLARIKALLRRQHQPANQPSERIQLAGLSIDRQQLQVTLNGTIVPLSSGEFELLWLLAQEAGKPVSREHLIQQLRGFAYDGIDRSIDLSISRLRRKLGDNGEQPQKIKTLRGKGYQLIKEAW